MIKIETEPAGQAIPTGDGATLGRNSRLVIRSGADPTTTTLPRMTVAAGQTSHPARLTQSSPNHDHGAVPDMRTMPLRPGASAIPIAFAVSRDTKRKRLTRDPTDPRVIRTIASGASGIGRHVACSPSSTSSMEMRVTTTQTSTP